MTEPRVDQPTFAEQVIKPDDLAVFTRATDLTPLAGRPERPAQETGRLLRYGRSIILVIPCVGSVLTEVFAQIEGTDTDDALAIFAAERQALLDAGWTVRDPEPWEIRSPLDSDTIPF